MLFAQRGRTRKEAMQIAETSAQPSVTPAAEQFMRRMVRFAGASAEAGFRLVVRPGGCSGLSSEFSVESKPAAGDQVIPLGSVQLFVSQESQGLLAGVTIDFRDGRQDSGLSFIDPKAGACGCSTGSSLVQLTPLTK
jgi:iron-sulfur cluster assembly protein